MQYTTLSTIARELGVNKSKLTYFCNMGILVPINEIGGMFVFNRKKTLSILKKIETLKDKGNTLKQIKNKLKKN